jgi:hypothetical protein
LIDRSALAAASTAHVAENVAGPPSQLAGEQRNTA